MNSLADAVELGLTRAVGVSNYSLRQMQRAHAALARRGVALASNQVRYSLLDRSPERSGLLQACRDLNVTLIAYSPLGMGMLTGKYGPGKPLPLTRRRRPLGLLPRIEPLLAALKRIGEQAGGKTPAQVALNWTMMKGTLPIPGAKNARQARENAGALGWALTAEQVGQLDEVSQSLGS
jgi:aryl-alcohol dehydrogenase-like predicted oxidoreductase